MTSYIGLLFCFLIGLFGSSLKLHFLECLIIGLLVNFLCSQAGLP